MQPRSGGNLHRNVIFRNSQVPALPIAFTDGPSAELLWDGLTKECLQAPGDCEAIAIPHNSNISAGAMFSGKRENGEPMTLAYVEQRHKLEPLVEIMQHKGSSECFYSGGLGADELCNFEQQPVDNIAGLPRLPQPETGFVRHALGQGMSLEAQFGVNPYQFGGTSEYRYTFGHPRGCRGRSFSRAWGGRRPSGRRDSGGFCQISWNTTLEALQ